MIIFHFFYSEILKTFYLILRGKTFEINFIKKSLYILCLDNIPNYQLSHTFIKKDYFISYFVLLCQNRAL